MRGIGLAALGIALGLALSLALTQTMASLLVGVTPTDPITFTAISALFGLVAALACLVPASRAARIDPMVTMREE